MKKIATFFTRSALPVALVLFAITSNALATTTGTGDAKELDSVWTKLSDGVSGTYGKIATLGIVGASIWNREKIGMLAMGAGIIIGVMVPSIPSIIDKVGYTI